LTKEGRPPRDRSARTRRRTVVFTFLVIGSAIFVADLLLPLGVGVGVLYPLLVPAGLWFERRQPTLVAAGVATTLALVGAVLSPPGVSLGFALLNRGISVIVIWVLALTLLRQKSAERRLVEEQRGTRGLLDVVEVVILELDAQGRVRVINRHGCKLIGQSENEIVGKIWFDTFLPERLRGDVREVFARLMAGETLAFEYYENPLLTADGRELVVAWHNSLLRGKDGTISGILSSGVDITEHKKAEEELRRSEALAQLGQMAAVVAHEVRNPLAGIAGALQIIGNRMEEASEERGITDEILERIDALNEMVESMLLYARPRTPRVAPIRLDGLLRDIVEVARRDPSLVEVDVKFGIAVNGFDLRGDAELLKVLFTNLLLNAGQAMDGKGRIDIGLRHTGGRCEISISDTGPGIPPEVREFMFEPFFTTKSRGTGLGMAISRQVVEAHDGEIAVECGANSGTTVIVTLPFG